jgi:phosphohistidine phosphatase SixA
MRAQVARKLAQRGFLPELILSSDSARTRQTLGAMADAEPGFASAAACFRGSLYTVAALDGQTLRHLQARLPACARITIAGSG